MSGAIGEEAAAAAMRAGARDCVMKGALGRLVPAIQRELREAADRRELARERQRSDVLIKENAETALEVMLEERPPPSGTVVLASDTPGALVTVDRVARGFTPAVLTLTTGTHDIEVRGERLTPWYKRVQVTTGARLFYDVGLDEAEQEVTGATRSVQTLRNAPASATTRKPAMKIPILMAVRLSGFESREGTHQKNAGTNIKAGI